MSVPSWSASLASATRPVVALPGAVMLVLLMVGMMLPLVVEPEAMSVEVS